MPLTIPNRVVAAFLNQAKPYSTDFDILVAALAGDGVISGCAVTAQGSPDMTVAVAAGSVRIAGAIIAVSSGNVTITTADGTNPRWDLITIDNAGARAAVAGTAAANPLPPAIPASRVVIAAVYVPSSDTAINSDQIIDKRVVLPSQTWTAPLALTPSTNQNDYNPTGLETASVLRLNIGATMKITGLQGGVDGRQITLANASTDYLLWLENENTASSAANRFLLPKGFPAFLMPGDTITLIYDGTSSRWRVKDWPNQGPAMGLTWFNDFIENTAGGLTSTVSGTGASNQASTYLNNTTERVAGITQIDTGTTTTGRTTLGSANTGDIIPTLGAALHIARLAEEAANSGTETYQLITGFADSAAGTFTDGVAWNLRWNGSAEEWSQDRLSNSTATRTASGSPTPDTNYITLAIFINPGWTRADMLYSTDGVSFTVASSPSTGFPASTRPTAWVAASMIKSAGTTQRNCSIDYAGYRIDQVRA